jgi:hypothetical protein
LLAQLTLCAFARKRAAAFAIACATIGCDDDDDDDVVAESLSSSSPTRVLVRLSGLGRANDNGHLSKHQSLESLKADVAAW